MMARLLIALFSAGLLLVKGAKNGPDNVKIDITGIVNPDPEATGIVMAEYNRDDRFYEGDILGVDKDEDGSNRGLATADESKLWPQGTVPYVLDSSVQDPMVKKSIEDAIADYELNTCIKWVPRTSEIDYVNIKTNEEGCWAWLGVQNGKQDLNLGHGCWSKGTAIHEMMHAIGFDHEQKRMDRDNYVRINYDNIPKKWHYAFDKWQESQDMGFKYDFQSIMHYNAYAFAADYSFKTITTVDPNDQNKIGQRAGFSVQDIKEVNMLYKCNGKTSGIAGENGCRDYNPVWCQESKGLKDPANLKKCDVHDLKKLCRKSCKVCGNGNSGSQTGGGANCRDGNREYCEGTLKLANGPNEHCKDSNIADYCKKSCNKC